jgi:GDP-4-dehydro-6-deoxy-D-mannose reductase
MPILVTGAAGFVGGYLLDLLGTGVVAWHRAGGRRPAPSPAGITWQAIDLLDPAAVHRAIAEVRPTAVYHCAGAAHVGMSWGDAARTLAVNVRGTHNLLEGLRRAGLAARVIIPGSAMVYAAADRALTEDDPLVPRSPYALSKLAQEMEGVRANLDGLHVTIARAFNHMGPRQDPFFAASGFARRIADIEAGRWEPEIAVGNLDARRDLTDVRDTIRAYRLILERGTPGRPYNVCSGRAITIRELLDRLLSRARVPIRVRVDAARLRPNDVPLLLGDPTRIQTELGWQPEIPLDRTLDDLLDDWRNRPPA